MPELVSPAIIAKRAGVKRGTVHRWVERHEDFPKPAVNVGRGHRLWHWEDVEQWMRETGRIG